MILNRLVNSFFLTFYMVVALASIGFGEKTKAKTSIGGSIQKYFLNKHKQYMIA